MDICDGCIDNGIRIIDGRHEIDALTRLMDDSAEDSTSHLTEYSDANMAFHKAIIRLGAIDLMSSLTGTLFIHMRAVRAVTMTQDNCAQRSVSGHRAVVAALRAKPGPRRTPDPRPNAGARRPRGTLRRLPPQSHLDPEQYGRILTMSAITTAPTSTPGRR
jgi:hypothetical protein